MKYCSYCGSSHLAREVPKGDTLPRLICQDCHTIHYQNPKIVAGCLAEWEDQVLLCQRAISPSYGLWTLPAGFMENHESLEQAAVRETWEEAQASVVAASLYVVISLPHINQVYMMFRAQLRELSFSPGYESLSVQLFRQQELPWQQLAFPVIHQTLIYYFQDRAAGHFPVHVSDYL